MARGDIICGLFGFSGKKNCKVNEWKLKILGIYNTERGIDSCGYYYSGNLVKGVDKVKDFKNLLAVDGGLFRGDGEYDIFMGHTRKSTGGTHSEDNAHPHLVQNEYIQTHNGMITNAWELCNKYKIDHSKIHVDSIGLAHVINQEGYRILGEYKGVAALVMLNKSQPDSLFLFHGESKEKENEEPWIERPLYFLHQPEGIYYSSMINSLEAICETDDVVKTLTTNCVFELKHGEFTKFNYKVDRSEINIKPIYKTHNLPFTPVVNQGLQTNLTKWMGKRSNLVNTITPIVTDKNQFDSILNEDYPEDYAAASNQVYYRHGRYYVCKNTLLEGMYLIDRDGRILGENEISDRVSDYFYFSKGVMLNNKLAYDEIGKIKITDACNVGSILSKYSRYPVISLRTEGSPVNGNSRFKWHHKGSIVRNDSFTPKFCSSKYVIRHGSTLNVTKDHKKFNKG